jgi:outer membrane lipoprotein LolB
MTDFMRKSPIFLLFVMLSLLLSACSAISPKTAKSKNETLNISPQTITQRNQQMNQLQHWRLKGKIAFIEQIPQKKAKRKSASLRWQYQQDASAQHSTANYKQQIDLTTFMGINILHVESDHNQHLIKIDGKSYSGDNLTEMIYALTGLTLPTQALNFWLKGLTYTSQDKISYNPASQLPQQLLSQFYAQGIYQTWQVDYGAYKLFSNHRLATKLTIRHNNLTIKIAINSWSML